MGQAVMWSGLWCYRCRNKIPKGQVHPRQTMVYVVEYQLWWKFRPGRFNHYQLQDFCPRCDAMEEEAARQKRGWGWVALLTVGAVIFGWMYFGLGTGLGVAGVVVVMGWVVSRRKKVEVLPAERGQYNE